MLINNQLLDFFKNFFFYVNNSEGKGKIVIGTNIPGMHYTVFIKGWSEYYDIHKTYPDGKHFTLFKIKKVDANLILSRLELAIPFLFQQHFFKKKLHLSELQRLNLSILPLNENIKEEDVIEYINPKKFKLKPKILNKKYVKNIISSKNIGRSKSYKFLVFDKRERTIGFIMRLPEQPLKEFVYIKRKNIREFFTHLLAVILYSIKIMDMKHKIKIQRTIVNFFNEAKI